MRIRMAAAGAMCAALGLGGAWSEAGAGAPAVGAEAGAVLGPPLVCVEVEIGAAKSLPWGSGAFGEARGYREDKLVEDTLGVLEASEDLLVHMETLRRATIYIGEDAELARELLGRLSCIAMDLEADASTGSGRRARAWFDAGYLAAALGHMGVKLGWKPGAAEGVQGYAWLREAIELSGGDAAMHFAAANAAHPGMRGSKRDLFELHMRAAVDGAAAGSPLARNIEAHLAHWDESIAVFRTAG